MVYLICIITLFATLWNIYCLIKTRQWQTSHSGRQKYAASTTNTLPYLCLAAPKPLWVRKKVIRLKALMPDAGCRKIASTFNRNYSQNKQMTVSKSYVNTVIREHQYEIQVLRKNIKHRRPKAVPKNLIWGVDLTGKTDSKKKTHVILGIIEHQSRGNLCLKALTDKSSATLLRCLLDCIDKYGKPKYVRTDNEAVFTSKLFRFGLLFLGIKHQKIDLHSPWQNGRIERFFGTLKERLNHWEIDSINQLNHALCEFRLWYNHVRPHQYLDNQTPAEVWAGDNIFQGNPRKAHWFEAWDGLLTGYYLPP